MITDEDLQGRDQTSSLLSVLRPYICDRDYERVWGPTSTQVKCFPYSPTPKWVHGTHLLRVYRKEKEVTAVLTQESTRISLQKFQGRNANCISVRSHKAAPSILHRLSPDFPFLYNGTYTSLILGLKRNEMSFSQIHHTDLKDASTKQQDAWVIWSFPSHREAGDIVC